MVWVREVAYFRGGKKGGAKVVQNVEKLTNEKKSPENNFVMTGIPYTRLHRPQGSSPLLIGVGKTRGLHLWCIGPADRCFVTRLEQQTKNKERNHKPWHTTLQEIGA